MLCFCFVFLRLLYPMLPVSLDFPFLIAHLVFSTVNFMPELVPNIFSKILDTSTNVLSNGGPKIFLTHDVLSAWINDSMCGIFNHPSAWLLIKVRRYTLYCHLIMISGLLWSISNSPDNERNDMFVCVLFSASTIEIHLSGTTCLSVYCSQLAL